MKLVFRYRVENVNVILKHSEHGSTPTKTKTRERILEIKLKTMIMTEKR